MRKSALAGAVCAALAVAALSQAAASTVGSATRLFDIGDTYFRHERLPPALRNWEGALALDGAGGNRRGEARDLGHIAVADEALGRYAEALKAVTAALALHRALGDRAGEAGDLGTLGVVDDDLGRDQAAEREQERALALDVALGDPLGVANAYGNIGIVEMRFGNYAGALQAHRRSLAIDRRIRNRVGEADEIGRIGIIDEELGHYDEALRELRRALAIHRSLPHLLGEAKALNNIGIVDEHLGRYAEALAAYRAALPFFREVGYRLGEAAALANAGTVSEDLGRYADALRAHEQALAVFRLLGNRLGEAGELDNVGIVDRDLGRYDDALRVLQEAIAIERALEDPLGEANALGNLGIVDEDLGRYETALAALQEALALHRKIRNKRGEASDLGDIGVVAGDLERYADAVDAQEKALSIDRDIKNRQGEADDLDNVGTLEERAGNYGEALRVHQMALAIYSAIHDRLGEAEQFSNVAVADDDLGRNADALAAAKRAVALEREIGAPESLWRALRIKARSEARLDLRDVALDDYDASIGQIESLRALLEGGSERRSFFYNKLFVYDEYIAYLVELDRRYPGAGYDQKALDVFEREQGRAFLEEVGQSSARRFAGVPPKITNEEADLARSVARVANNLTRARASSASDPQALSADERELAALRGRATTLEGLVRREYPAYYQLTHPEPAGVATLRQLLGPNQAMLVYRVLADETVLWVIGPTGMRLFVLSGGADVVQAKVGALLDTIQKIGDAANTPGLSKSSVLRKATELLPTFTRLSAAAYDWVLPAEARTLIGIKTTLYIVPTGGLYKLPWEALVTNDPASSPPRYLIDDHAISYLSSASLLAVLRNAEAHRTPQRYPIVAFANPDFGSAAPAPGAPQTVEALRMHALAPYGSNGSGDAGFPPLPGTEEEAQAVVDILGAPRDSHPLYDGDDASRANVLRLQSADCAAGPCLRSFRYILFATHAVLPDEVEGLVQPALILSHPERRQEGFLTMGDVFGLTLDADVVSLSACNTGNGAYVRGDGVRGLTQAFMFAGTSVVTVTLWELSDLAAAKMTPAFYAGLKNGKSPADALRDAKLQVLHGGDRLLTFPYFWAATVAFGDGAR
jgi:tetratricopeptide (TPR) repeat protein/CHAT domain-containing protein